MKYSILGYKDISNDKNEDSLIIPSNIITMKGVSRPLTLVPIINGKPLYSKKIIAKPGDPDINFGNDVEGVLELPYAQNGLFTNKGLMETNSNPYLNMGMGTNFSNIPMPKYFTPPTPPTLEEYQKQQSEKYNNYDGSIPPSEESINKWNSQQDTFFNGKNKIETDPNNLQKMEASLKKYELDQQDQKGNPFIGAINPYGSWNMNNASVALGSFAGMKVDPNSKNADRQRVGKTLGIIGSAGKILLEGARNAFSGAGSMKVYQESLAEQQKRLAEQQRKQTMYYAQKGGEISNKEGLLSTGNFIYGNEKILESVPKIAYYRKLLQGKNILNAEFDSNTNEYIITYE